MFSLLKIREQTFPHFTISPFPQCCVCSIRKWRNIDTANIITGSKCKQILGKHLPTLFTFPTPLFKVFPFFCRFFLKNIFTKIINFCLVLHEVEQLLGLISCQWNSSFPCPCNLQRTVKIYKYQWGDQRIGILTRLDTISRSMNIN